MSPQLTRNNHLGYTLIIVQMMARLMDETTPAIYLKYKIYPGTDGHQYHKDLDVSAAETPRYRLSIRRVIPVNGFADNHNLLGKHAHPCVLREQGLDLLQGQTDVFVSVWDKTITLPSNSSGIQ